MEIIRHCIVYFSTKHYQCHTCHKSFHIQYYMDRHIREVHLNNSINCTICDRTCMRKGDLKRHMMKEHPTPQTSSTTTAPREWDIPQSFFDLLDQFENTELQHTEASQPNLNKATQTSGNKINHYPTKHQTCNTDKCKVVDKSTNTDPLIILEPKDIQNLISGFKLITFEVPDIFLQTTNSTITPKPKFEPKYVPTPISTKPRTEKESNINQLVKKSIAKTKCETITKVQNLKIKKEVKKPNLDKLVDKYYPRLRDQLKSKPKYAHVNKKPKNGLAGRSRESSQ